MTARPPWVLVAETDPQLAGLITRTLTRAGMRVSVAAEARELAPLLEQRRYSLLIVGATMAGAARQRFYAELREATTAPVLALAEPGEELEARAAGADACLALPLRQEALLTQARALLARGGPAPGAGTIMLGSTQIDLRRRRAERQGREIKLTRVEWALLEELARCPRPAAATCAG